MYSMSQLVKVIVGEVGKTDDNRSGLSSMEADTKKGRNTDSPPPSQSNLNEDPNVEQRSTCKGLPSSDNLPGIKVTQVKKEDNGNVKKMDNIAERFAVKVKNILMGNGHNKGLKKGKNNGYKMGPKKGYNNTGPHNSCKVGFGIVLIISVLCFVSITAPYFLACFGYVMNPENVLNFPLENSSTLPAVITYKLHEAYIFNDDGFSGLIFSHGDLVPEVDNLFSHFRDLKPLLPLIDTDYYILTECPSTPVTQYYLTTIVFWGMILFWIIVFVRKCKSSKNSKAVSANQLSFMFNNLEFAPTIAIALIYSTLLVGPIFNEGNESRNVLRFPLKNTLFAPTYISYQFGNAYILGRENHSGVVFSNEDLVSKFGSYTNGSESVTPLLPLVHPDYKDCNMEVNIAVTFPLIISVSVGVLFYFFYVIIGFGVKLGKRYHGGQVGQFKIKI